LKCWRTRILKVYLELSSSGEFFNISAKNKKQLHYICLVLSGVLITLIYSGDIHGKSKAQLARFT
jgi:hypothetical protein